MSEPKNQHIIPQCYLKQFVDPNTPVGQEPYVWIFERGSKKGKKKAPKNILTETDFYTVKVSSGEKDYTIEKTLSQIESEYASVFENKIKRKIPLNGYEHAVFCVFVAAMLQRTLKQKENIEGFFDQVIEKTEQMERANGAPPKTSLELKKQKEDAHKMSVVQMIPEITKFLVKMNVAFLCTKKSGSLITTDAPCFLFNSQTQGQGFYSSPGFGQRHVEVRMPLSPEISASFSWVNNLRGYLEIETAWIHELNRAVFGHSHQYFIASSPKIKRRWFSPFPLNPFFLLRVLIRRAKIKIQELRYRHKRHV